MISCVGGEKEMASYNAYKLAIEKACKGMRVNAHPRWFYLTDEMIRFNGEVPFTIRKRGVLYCYVVSAAPAFGSKLVHVFLTMKAKASSV